MAAQARQDRAPQRCPERGGAGLPGLGGREQAVLGLVVSGGLGYREAALLRAALITLAAHRRIPGGGGQMSAAR
jgi:hypothetical protein